MQQTILGTNIQKFNSFSDIYTIVKSFTNKEKGDLFEELTKYIFLYHHRYRFYTKQVWLFNEIPQNVMQFLNLPPTDQGIDLVLVDKNDKYYAIQCKFKIKTDKKIPCKNLGTFYGLTFGIASKFSGGFYVTNTDEIPRIFKTSKRVALIYGDFFNDISTNFFNELKSIFIKTINFKPILFIPRPYQDAIILKTIEYFNNENKGYIEMACGSGKTLTSYWIDSGMTNKLTIVVVPSLFLLSQFYNDWAFQIASEMKKKYEFILVGSDNDKSEIIFNANDLIVTTSPITISTNITQIIKRYEGNHKIIIVTTYQSSDKLIEGLKNIKIVPDLCIFDEAYKTVGQMDKQFNILLDDKNIQIKKRLFMIATPKIFSENIESDKILSMNNEIWYGKSIDVFNTFDAIKKGCSVDYEIVTLYTNDQHIEQLIIKNKYIEHDKKTIDRHSLANAIMLLSQFAKTECNHLLTYHNSIDSSKQFKILLETLIKERKLNITVFNVDGSHTMKQRIKIFNEFTKVKLAIMVSSRVLSEGVNLPIIDSVCFINPITSSIDIIQCASQALRLCKDKVKAKIYIPIIINDMDNIDEKIVFGNIIKILRCLNDTDSDISEYFKAIQNGKTHDRQLIRHVNNLGVEIIGENININDWMNTIDIKLWQRIDGFEYKFIELKIWIDANQRMPSQHSNDNYENTLGKFCSRLRQSRTNNSLDNYKIDKLNTIDLWYWSTKQMHDKKSWNETYIELKEFVKENNRLPSLGSSDIVEKKLAKFCSNQKSDKRHGTLSIDQINKLNEIPAWDWGDENIKIIKSQVVSLKDLKQWITEKNVIPSQHSNNEIEAKLGNFASKLRQLKKKNKLSNDMVEELNTISIWYWNLDDVFETRYTELQQWMNDHKRIPLVRSNNEQETKLARFCEKQKQNKKKINYRKNESTN